MKESGYSPGCIDSHNVRWRLYLIPFLEKESSMAYTIDLGRKFLHGIIPTLRPSTVRRFKRSIRILDAYIATGNIPKHAPRVAPPPLPGAIGKVAQEFLEHKKQGRCALITVEHHRRLLSYFTVSMETQGKVDLSQITEDDVLSFLDVPESKQARFSAMKQFYRYVGKHYPGKPDYSYVFEFTHFVPTRKLPSAYSLDEIRIVEESIDRSSAIGKRTYAMFLLASRLGLRISDITNLRFDNIDWDQSTIKLSQVKTGKPIELPLLAPVGEAIISYLRVRPDCDLDYVFVTHTPPLSMMNRSGASKLISNAITGSGIDGAGRKHGPHSLRSSLATRMLEEGTDLPVISDSLGHGGNDITMEYLRIDIGAIRRCMLEVPPVTDSFYGQQNGIFYI